MYKVIIAEKYQDFEDELNQYAKQGYHLQHMNMIGQSGYCGVLVNTLELTQAIQDIADDITEQINKTREQPNR